MRIYKHFTNEFAAVQSPSGNYILKTGMLETGIAEVPAAMIERSHDWSEEKSKDNGMSEEVSQMVDQIFKNKH